MRNSSVPFLLLVGVILLTTAAAADDVTGKDKILCTTIHVTECFADGECNTGPPEIWNIPRFTRVDLTRKTMQTTQASGENRETEIERIEQEGDDVFIQGAEGGRGYTVALDLDTGTATFAIAMEGSVLAGFSACTPLDAAQ
jgi:hypothetical protein